MRAMMDKGRLIVQSALEGRKLELAAILISIFAGVLAYSANSLSKKSASTELYVAMKQGYNELRLKKDALSQVEYTVRIENCALLSTEGILLGDFKYYAPHCEVKYFKKRDHYQWTENYWRHSFDEWFTSKEWGLSESLWNDFYRQAIFPAMNRHRYAITLCKMVNGGSSFAGQAKDFRKDLLKLYKEPPVISAYFDLFDLKRHDLAPLDCLREYYQPEYFSNNGFGTSKDLAVYNSFLIELRAFGEEKNKTDKVVSISKEELRLVLQRGASLASQERGSLVEKTIISQSYTGQ